jgi:hypothetical protein
MPHSTAPSTVMHHGFLAHLAFSEESAIATKVVQKAKASKTTVIVYVSILLVITIIFRTKVY